MNINLGNREDQKIKFKEMIEIAERVNGVICTKCYRRGYESWNAEMGQFIPCICVVKAARKIELEKRKKKPEVIEEKIN